MVRTVALIRSVRTVPRGQIRTAATAAAATAPATTGALLPGRSDLCGAGKGLGRRLASQGGATSGTVLVTTSRHAVNLAVTSSSSLVMARCAPSVGAGPGG